VDPAWFRAIEAQVVVVDTQEEGQGRINPMDPIIKAEEVAPSIREPIKAIPLGPTLGMEP
jgi:hypothetical protein